MSMPWIYKLEFIMINSCISSTFIYTIFLSNEDEFIVDT